MNATGNVKVGDVFSIPGFRVAGGERFKVISVSDDGVKVRGLYVTGEVDKVSDSATLPLSWFDGLTPAEPVK